MSGSRILKWFGAAWLVWWLQTVWGAGLSWKFGQPLGLAIVLVWGVLRLPRLEAFTLGVWCGWWMDISSPAPAGLWTAIWAFGTVVLTRVHTWLSPHRQIEWILLAGFAAWVTIPAVVLSRPQTPAAWMGMILGGGAHVAWTTLLGGVLGKMSPVSRGSL